jgi:transcriptional regulator with XRE-family HTH domain
MIDKIGRTKPPRHYISEWIAYRGLDQNRVAERMECEPGTLSKLINGKMRIDLSWLARIAAALDVEPGALFHDPNRPTADELLKSLNPTDRARAFSFIEGLKRTG